MANILLKEFCVSRINYLDKNSRLSRSLTIRLSGSRSISSSLGESWEGESTVGGEENITIWYVRGIPAMSKNLNKICNLNCFFLYANIATLMAKFNEFRSLVSHLNPSIFCVTETFLRPTLLSTFPVLSCTNVIATRREAVSVWMSARHCLCPSALHHCNLIVGRGGGESVGFTISRSGFSLIVPPSWH